MNNDSPINDALRKFEATEANLEKLESIWQEIRELISDGINFGSNPKYDDRVRAYMDVLSGLPKIDKWKPETIPLDLDEIAQHRLDAREVEEIEGIVAVEKHIETPGRELADYRHRLNKTRRQLIRKSMSDLIARVDSTLRVIEGKLPPDVESNQTLSTDPDWDALKNEIQAIETLLGSAMPRPASWSTLWRHLHFGMVCDLRDIVASDWPNAKTSLTRGSYGKDEPIPVEVEDLGVLAATEPTGTIATKLKWELLKDDEFERLMFTLISTTSGYENPSWLTATNAPDRGRDLAVIRVTHDKLSGVKRHRVIIQCKHWLTKSISLSDVSTLKEAMNLWQPPKVDVLIIATSGRFTTDALDFIEKHNESDRALSIEMWPESHLERLLAERPALIAELRLR